MARSVRPPRAAVAAIASMSARSSRSRVAGEGERLLELRLGARADGDDEGVVGDELPARQHRHVTEGVDRDEPSRPEAGARAGGQGGEPDVDPGADPEGPARRRGGQTEALPGVDQLHRGPSRREVLQRERGLEAGDAGAGDHHAGALSLGAGHAVILRRPRPRAIRGWPLDGAAFPHAAPQPRGAAPAPEGQVLNSRVTRGVVVHEAGATTARARRPTAGSRPSRPARPRAERQRGPIPGASAPAPWADLVRVLAGRRSVSAIRSPHFARQALQPRGQPQPGEKAATGVRHGPDAPLRPAVEARRQPRESNAHGRAMRSEARSPDMRRHLLILAGAPAALAALSLAVAGCGDDSGSSASTPAATTAPDTSGTTPAAGATTAATTAPAAATKVAVLMGKPTEFSLSAVPVRVATGKTTFIVANNGAILHEMVVVPSTGGAAALRQPDGHGQRRGQPGRGGRRGAGRRRSAHGHDAAGEVRPALQPAGPLRQPHVRELRRAVSAPPQRRCGAGGSASAGPVGRLRQRPRPGSTPGVPWSSGAGAHAQQAGRSAPSKISMFA